MAQTLRLVDLMPGQIRLLRRLASGETVGLYTLCSETSCPHQDALDLDAAGLVTIYGGTGSSDPPRVAAREIGRRLVHDGLIDR